MVTAVDEARITDIGNNSVSVDVTGVYVLPMNAMIFLGQIGAMNLDLNEFSKTIQGEAFALLGKKNSADLVLVTRIKNNELRMERLSGYRRYELTLDGKAFCALPGGCSFDTAVLIRAAKAVVSRTIKLKSIKFDLTQVELAEISSTLFN